MKNENYWDQSKYWRHYGDVENNWGQSGNQQSLAEAALAEKIVNSVDARLIHECRKRNINPKSTDAPRSIREAVADFFDENKGGKISTGDVIREWGQDKIRNLAEETTFCATGIRPSTLNITIVDKGEGQTAKSLPNTILSLNKSNKMYIPFVQGQFNQGGTGALRFCGDDNLQLVISRRAPDLLDTDADPKDYEWCFTVVRRERPSGGRKNSMYTYLAPVSIGGHVEDRRGSILSFPAETLGIFPNDEGPYEKHAFYGTVIKMYDYKFIGDKSNILRGKSLLSRLNLLLPEIALPVRFYEYRTNENGKYLERGSRRTTALGLLRRINDNENVEQGFPVSIPFQSRGEKLVAHIYAFVPSGTVKKSSGTKNLGGLRNYRKSEGVLFLRNGQTQGSWSKDFFRRKAVKMPILADDLLVFVECDELSDNTREDLFMPSRDRLAENDFKHSLLKTLEETIRECHELKTLRNKRQQERLQARLKDEKPLTDMLQDLIMSSPNLVNLLQLGHKVSAPFNTKPTNENHDAKFKGETYPTYFKYKGLEYGIPVKITRPINSRIRLTFETNARNDYFTRAAERGSFDWLLIDGDKALRADFTGPNLRNGIATTMISFPDEAEIGRDMCFVAKIYDSIRSFKIHFTITPHEDSDPKPGGKGGSTNPPGKQKGKNRETPLKIKPPNIIRVYREEWNEHKFDEFTAMKVESLGPSDDGSEIYEFKVNMDNILLITESKLKQLDDNKHKLLSEQFLYANVLVGLSLLLEDQKKAGNESPDNDSRTENVLERIDSVCRALAPFVPTLVSLGSADLESDNHFEGLEGVG
ncbi:MAG: hypothetical protein F4077_01680 [Gammaproteobacteria bacterium]|nr:hypothetical protein [Gammaproteobacteria bacterium]